MNTVERARGRWREILPQFGIGMSFLRNKHGPCPVCGGRDRFRFDDRDGSGSYFCNQCGAGNGILLIRKSKGWDHKTACDEVDRIIGTAPIEPPKPRPPMPAEDRANEARIRRLLDEADDLGVVDAYLTRRGLTVTSPVLQGHPSCPYWDDDTRRIIGRYPTVVAPITAPDGRIVSAQRIYDTDVGPGKKTLPPVGTINGAAVRLHEHDGELGVSEGVVTGLAAHELSGLPVWACLSAHGLETFDPPPGVLQLHVFADNDRNAEGQAAAFNLARKVNRQNRQQGSRALPVIVHIPPQPDTDWRDVLAGDPPP